MTIKTNYLLLLLLGISLLNACKKKEEDPIAPTASFTVSKMTVVVDEEVQFTNTSAEATSYQWSFGDGTTSTEASPKKSFSTSNTFTVTLVSTGPGGTKSAVANVVVLPLSTFTVENEASLSAGTAVQFTNGSKGATSYVWFFGDAAASSSNTANPSFTYATGGTYTVTLTASGAGGPSISTKTITVAAPPAVKELYYIEYGASLLQKVALDGSSNTATVLDIAGKAGAGMAIDAINKKVYFSDFEVTGSGAIWQMNLDGSGLTAIVSNLTDPYGVAVDPSGGKVYWADDLGNISRANLDGSSLETGIVNVPGGLMRAVALDPENNKMYYYEVQAEILYVANLDGSNPTAILTASYGYALLIDTVNDKIYYDEQNAGKIFRVNLDGSGQVEIDADGSRCYGMAIDYSENKIYWSLRESGKILRANLDGTNPEPVATGLTSPRGIALKL